MNQLSTCKLQNTLQMLKIIILLLDKIEYNYYKKQQNNFKKITMIQLEEHMKNVNQTEQNLKNTINSH